MGMSGHWVWLSIRGTLESDLHTGTGTGDSGIDAVLLRDRDGKPVIHRTHLKGVLREIAKETYGDKLAKELFGPIGGGPHSAILRSLRWEEGGPARCWTSTARRGFDDRGPEDDTLRIVEYVPAGSVFNAICAIQARLKNEFEKILYLCDCLGHGRTRGDGRIRWEVNEFKAPSVSVPSANGNSCIRILLKALEPLTLPQTGHPGNIIRTEPFIRGQALQGALINSIIRWTRQRSIAQQVEWEKISVGDAIPLPEGWDEDAIKNNLGSIEFCPIPLNLRFSKPGGAELGLPWWALEEINAVKYRGAQPQERPLSVVDGLGEDSDPSLKRPASNQFIARLATSKGVNKWIRYNPRIYVHLRNAQGAEENGAPLLFATEEIAEGTFFLADLHMPADEKVAAQFIEAFDRLCKSGAWLTVGRGGAPIEILKVAWLPDATQSSQRNPLGQGAPATFRLTLTSDLLIRDEWLNGRTKLDEAALAQACAVKDNFQLTPKREEEDVLFGFNARSGLPRAPVSVIRRGSTYRVSGSGAERVWNALQGKSELGERNEIGLGRFRLDLEEQPPGFPLIELPKRSTMESDGTREAMLERAHRIAEKIRKGKGPSRSQWFALRADMRNQKTMDEIKGIIKGLGEPRGGQAWREIASELHSISNCNSKDEACKLVDALVRWMFSKARR
jgi:hypothetical protein